jgi:hypothetical protein
MQLIPFIKKPLTIIRGLFHDNLGAFQLALRYIVPTLLPFRECSLCTIRQKPLTIIWGLLEVKTFTHWGQKGDLLEIKRGPFYDNLYTFLRQSVHLSWEIFTIIWGLFNFIGLGRFKDGIRS